MSKKQRILLFPLIFIIVIILAPGTLFVLFRTGENSSGKQDQSNKQTTTQESEKEEIAHEDTSESEDTKQEEILTGSGTLTASGNGNAYIEGNGTVTVSEEKGTIIVTDNAGDAEITLEGFQNRIKLDDNKWKYTNTGSATVTGSDIIVEASGENIQLTATGTKTATLKGTGTIAICPASQECVEGQWSEDGTEVKLTEE